MSLLALPHKLMLSTLILRKLSTVLPTINCFLNFGLLVSKGIFGNSLEVTSLQECSVTTSSSNLSPNNRYLWSASRQFLGPLLLLVFVNDYPASSSSSCLSLC